MPDRPQIAALVLDVLAALWPGRFDDTALAEDVSLGRGGLGLDSIDIVDLVLACEARIGRSGDGAEDILKAEPPISIGRLIDHLTVP